ncbi:MAG: hypothetical protein IT256_09380, partial [Chitinophagaceae bacterium]|nr:hypothetical protein [Chitinophagaceae bacterium]
VFPGDGFPIRSIVTSKQNVLFAKANRLYLSEDNGQNFNPLRADLINLPLTSMAPNFILDIPGWNKLYVSNLESIRGKVSISPENGTYFNTDTMWTKDQDSAYNIESYTFTEGNLLFGYSPTGSVIDTTKLYVKKTADGRWEEVRTNLSKNYQFYLSHNGSSVIATDYNGLGGAFYSSDEGKTFSAYAGLPVGKKLYSTYAAKNIVLVGTEKNGVYVTTGTTFATSNSGIDAQTTVYGIVSKENYFKNKVTKTYFYLATSTGIYKSEDMAKSWIKVYKNNDFRTIY